MQCKWEATAYVYIARHPKGINASHDVFGFDFVPQTLREISHPKLFPGTFTICSTCKKLSVFHFIDAHLELHID